MALVSSTRPVIAAVSPPYPPMAIMTGQDTAGPDGGSPAESAHKRLVRALQYLPCLVFGPAVTSSQANAYRAQIITAGSSCCFAAAPRGEAALPSA